MTPEKKIRKAVISAAGFGTRFLPAVKAFPKELIPIWDRPSLQYLIEEIIAAGLKEVIVVHREGYSEIEEYFTPHPRLEEYLKKINKGHLLDSLRKIWREVKLDFIPQSINLPYGNAAPVIAAEKLINGEPFVYIFGDDLLLEDKPGKFLAELINIFGKYQPAVVAGVQEVPWEEIYRYGSIKYRSAGKIPNEVEALTEKLPADQAPSNMAQFGRFVVAPRVFETLKKQKLGKDNELYFADLENSLAQSDLVIAEPIKDGQWLTTGDPLRWLKANIEFALKKPDVNGEFKEYLKGLKI
jgi:UTP--glucose-1-phosphate uridylyltransferase